MSQKVSLDPTHFIAHYLCIIILRDNNENELIWEMTLFIPVLADCETSPKVYYVK